MATIAVLGGGIGGLSQVYELRKELGRNHDVVLIGDSEYFEFTPSNPWLAVGWRKPEQIVVDLPERLARQGIGFHAQGARRVHPERNSIELSDGTYVDYDFLVIATGPKLAFDEVPGLGPDGHTQSVCKTGHATAPSSLVRQPVRPASGPRTSMLSSSIPSSSAARSATACRCTSSRRSPMSVISASTGSATRAD
jgi:sulfide:quinone oxidoreductase